MKVIEDFETFEEEFQRHINLLPYEQLERGITQVFVNPNLSQRLSGEIHIPREMKLRELEILAYSTWYMPNKEIGWMIRIQILELQKRFSFEDQVRLSQYLESKAEADLYIIEFAKYHPRDIFGNILPAIRRYFNAIKFTNLDMSRIPEEKRIGVGYKDKGQLAQSDHRTGRDYSLDLLHEEIERKRKTFKDTLNFLKGSGG